jgi:hypothetical protein
VDTDGLRDYFSGQLPNIAEALIILILGLIVALVLRAVIRGILDRTGLDERLSRQVSPNEVNIANLVSTGVFWLVLLFAIVAAMDALELGIITGPFNNFLSRVVDFIPNLIGAAVLALVAWVIATIARRLVEGAVQAANLDQRAQASAGVPQNVSLGQSLGTLVYWLVWLLFLPGILDALGLEGLLAPVQGLVTDLVNFLPNLASAVIILVVGYFVARIVRDIVTNLLASTGIDRLAQRVGFSSAAPTTATVPASPAATSSPSAATTPMATQSQPMTLSRLLGTVVFALILIPVVISALDALSLEALSTPAIAMLNQVLNAIPNIFAAAILLAIAYFVARLIADLVRNILAGLGFDRILSRIGLRSATSTTTGRQPSDIAGTIIFAAIMLFAAAEAAGLLGFEQLSGLVGEFLVFFGNVILGLIVLGLGLYLANLAEQTIRSSDVQNRDILATVARYAIILLAVTMALRQMGIAEDIVTLAFGLLLGAIAIAAALAFGLGGRDLAARELERMRKDLKDRPQPPPEPPVMRGAPPIVPPGTPPPTAPPRV